VLEAALEFWWELALLVVIMLLGHWIEMRPGADRLRAGLLAALLPDEAERVQDGEVVTVAPAELAVGDVVLVRPGVGCRRMAR
jgi:Cu2+-exporting ATPase